MITNIYILIPHSISGNRDGRKNKDDDTTTRSTSSNTTNVHDVYDTLKENLVRAVDETAKFQPQFSQSLSNLQIDYIQTTKNVIQNSVSVQKQFVYNMNIPSVAITTIL